MNECTVIGCPAARLQRLDYWVSRTGLPGLGSGLGFIGCPAARQWHIMVATPGLRPGIAHDRLPLMVSVASQQQLPPSVEVVIEIPRGSFLKRGSTGQLDFVSPFPCPYNYGSIHQYIGGEGDFLDAVVLGPRLPAGSRVQVNAYGAIGLSERFMSDDKLICALAPIAESDCRRVLRFFKFYAFCKGLLNVMRGHSGPSRCDGWGEAAAAIARAVPIEESRRAPKINF